MEKFKMLKSSEEFEKNRSDVRMKIHDIPDALNRISLALTCNEINFKLKINQNFQQMLPPFIIFYKIARHEKRQKKFTFN